MKQYLRPTSTNFTAILLRTNGTTEHNHTCFSVKFQNLILLCPSWLSNVHTRTEIHLASQILYYFLIPRTAL